MGDLPRSGVELLNPPLIQVVAETDAYGGAISLLPPGGERVLRLASVAGIPRELAKPWMRVGLDAPIPLATSVRERRLLWLASKDMAGRYPQAAVTLPAPFAVADVPILSGDVCWGALVLLWLSSHPPTLAPEEISTIQSCCARLGELLEEAAGSGTPIRPGPEPHVVSRPRNRTPGTEEALAGADFAERLAPGCCALNLEGRVSFVSATAAELLGSSVEELLGARPWDVLPWVSDLVYEDRYRAALLSRRATSFTACRPPDRWLRFELHPDSSGVSILITPVEAAGEEETEAEGRYRDGRVAAEAARRESEREQGGGLLRAGTLYHLMQFAASLAETTSVKDVIDLVANQLMPAFDAQGLVLFMAEGDRLRVAGFRGYKPEVVERFDGAPSGAPPTPAVRALTDGVPSFYSTPEELEAVAPGIPALVRKCAWAYLPLIASGKPVGCWVLSYDRPRAFPPDERTILTSLAGLIAQGLERARLHDATHQLARRLQEGLLPRELPEIPGLDVAARYLPATRGLEIGGDFYDLIRLDSMPSGGMGTAAGPSSAVAAAIGDVQGHNVTAAALMGQVRTAVHATAGASPAEVLTRTNRLLTDLDPGLFTSCLYVHLDLAGHRARLANAGHPPPLLRHPDGRVTVLRMPPGPLLGILPEAEYPAIEVPLPPGAVLVLYTDGLVEAPDVDLDDATEELACRLARISADTGHARQTVDALADTLLRLAHQTTARSDDIALLLLSPR